MSKQPNAVWFPRLTRRDYEALAMAHARLVAIHRTLEVSNWSGKLPVMVSIDEADAVIAAIWNRAERFISRQPGARRDPPGTDHSGEFAPAMSVSEPAATLPRSAKGD